MYKVEWIIGVVEWNAKGEFWQLAPLGSNEVYYQLFNLQNTLGTTQLYRDYYYGVKIGGKILLGTERRTNYSTTNLVSFWEEEVFEFERLPYSRPQ